MIIDNPPISIAIYLQNGVFTLTTEFLLDLFQNQASNFTLSFMPTFSLLYKYFNFSLTQNEVLYQNDQTLSMNNYSWEDDSLSSYTLNEEQFDDALFSYIRNGSQQNDLMYCYTVNGSAQCLSGQFIDTKGNCQYCPYGSFYNSLSYCQICPENMICMKNQLILNPGFWKSDEQSTNSFPCAPNPDLCL